MLQIPCGGARSSKVNKAEQSTLGIWLYSQTLILTSSARSQNPVADFRHHVCPELGIIYKFTFAFTLPIKLSLPPKMGFSKLQRGPHSFSKVLSLIKWVSLCPFWNMLNKNILWSVQYHPICEASSHASVRWLFHLPGFFLPARMAKERKESGNRQEVGWLPTRCCAVASIATVL